ncbi:MAG: hypothetical protein V2A70_08540 [Candidatus Omnitrophota bacterium]
MDKQVISSEPAKKGFVLPASFYQTWIMTGGVYMMAGRCPCCGGQGCPVGLGTAVLVGGTMAGLTHGVGALRKVITNNKRR